MVMQWLKDRYADAATSLAKYNNAPFKNALMATCALIAAADGDVSKEERAKVVKLIQGNEKLAVFDVEELRELFLGYVGQAGDEFRRINVLNVVAKMKGRDEEAETCLGVAMIIANADGTFDAKERAVVAEICGRLGLPVERFVPAA